MRKYLTIFTFFIFLLAGSVQKTAAQVSETQFCSGHDKTWHLGDSGSMWIGEVVSIRVAFAQTDVKNAPIASC